LCAALAHVWNSALASQSLPESFGVGKLALISKIPKGSEAEKCKLTNYRPITLLNPDYKLIAKALAEKLKFPTTRIVGKEQCGFVAGRDIRCSVVETILAMEGIRKEEKEAALILLDFEKAYDRVYRP
jgi:hypothetical protein